MNSPNSASAEGCKLYHAVWELVGANFFDTTRLADWSSWEHRFDGLIVDEESALPYVDQMLASLKDPYTERVVPISLPMLSTAPVPETDTSNTAPAPIVKKPANVMSVLRPDNIGYLQILNFDHEEIYLEVEAAIAKIADCDGLILDLRTNSGGRMHRAIQTCALFIENGLITTVELRHEKGGVTLRKYCLTADQFFCVEVAPDGTETTEMYERPAPLIAGKPVVVLLHRRTASAAEMVACALVQNGFEGKMLTVGGTTAGKGIGQAEFDVLDGKMTIKITRSRWLAPGGDWLGDCKQTVANPMEPDILVPEDRGMEGFKVALLEMRKMLGRETD
jgi:C-terminal processing protease CtpA/Prc